MSVKIEYLLKNQIDLFELEIPFNQYFDLDDDEVIEINSVPIYSQPFQYINININEIILLKLSYEINNEKRVLKQTFWNNGNNILTERIDVGIENYSEIILSFKINEENNIYETLRLRKGENYLFPTYHGLFHK